MSLDCEIGDGIAIVTLNRPDALNALDAQMHTELPETWARLGADRAVRAIVITGAGRGFCVGMDLKRTDREGFRQPSSDRVVDLLRMTPVANDVWLPTVVAVNGVCAGGGLHFVADADIVVASTDASFVDTHVDVGQVTALEPISLMPRIGFGNALKLAVLGREGRLDAAEAHRIGLVDEVVEPDALLARATALAAAAATGSPAAIERSKKAIWAALDVPFWDAMQAGWDSIVEHRAHPDATEGPAAFAEKRRPSWQ
ncbi:MAG: enoyl-CoA hydratase/isomerase family protein [Actinomycetota bacterium]